MKTTLRRLLTNVDSQKPNNTDKTYTRNTKKQREKYLTLDQSLGANSSGSMCTYSYGIGCSDTTLAAAKALSQPCLNPLFSNFSTSST